MKRKLKVFIQIYTSPKSLKNIGTIDSFLEPEQIKNCPKITEKEALQLEGLISVEEATKYMKTCRSDASPGSSGFTGGFINVFGEI